MVDACTIGITLALDNGVSEGLATIRRDLSTLNGVVDSSAVRLNQLTRVGADLQYWPRAPSSDANQPPRSEFSEDGKPKPPAEISSWDYPARLGWNPSSLDKPTKLYIDMLSTQGSKSTGSPSAFVSSHYFIGSSDDESFASRGSISPSSTGHQAAETIDRASVNPSNYGPPDFPGMPPTIVEDRMRGSLSVMPSMTTTGSPSSIGAETPQPLSGDPSGPRSLPGACPQGFASKLWPRSTQRDSSPNSPTFARDLAVETHRSGVEATLPLKEASQTESQSPRLQGDIFIDGSKLGRWMTDRLVRAAGMPRAAATGFDSRMTPTWPGAPMSA
jgi:hypothetical protein